MSNILKPFIKKLFGPVSDLPTFAICAVWIIGEATFALCSLVDKVVQLRITSIPIVDMGLERLLTGFPIGAVGFVIALYTFKFVSRLESKQ